MTVGDSGLLPIDEKDIVLLCQYLNYREKIFDKAFGLLRTEVEALAYCDSKNIVFSTTTTKSKDHHQSSKAMVASVTHVAKKVAAEMSLGIESDPQKRCVWGANKKLHVTARNLDGAIPGLANPTVIWEIKEYWGKTSGGSKMSDAVYECHLVGRELREFEERSGVTVTHIVFVDGLDQWKARKSDLARFLDLMNQGIIDYLFVGKEVEECWEASLREIIQANSTGADPPTSTTHT